MRFMWDYQLAIFALITGHVTSTDLLPKGLRRQPQNDETNERRGQYDSYRDLGSYQPYLEAWDRWLQQDLSMKTNAPKTAKTRQPVKAPVRPPQSKATFAPIIVPSKAPIAPFPSTPGSMSPLSLAPVRPPLSIAPVRPPSSAPIITPITPPTLAPIITPISPPILVPIVAPVRPPSSAPIVPVALPSISPSKAPKISPVTKAPISKAPVTPPTVPRGTLLRLIQTDPQLSTLLAAISTSDGNRNMPPFLLELLNSTNTTLTIFAPINAGFNRLSQVVPGYLTQLLTANFGLHLTEILAYHVTAGVVSSSTFPRSNLRMLGGGTVNVAVSNSSFVVQSFSSLLAQILPPPDSRATNGLLHVVNNVLLPEFVFFDLFEGLQFANSQNGGQFSTLLRLIAAAGLQLTLENASGVTLIAPVNSGIPIETETFLLQPGNEAILSDVVRYHVLTELFNFAAQKTSTVALFDTLLQSARVVVGVVPMATGGVFTRYNQAVQSSYWLAKEGVLYTVDRILIPPLLRPVIPGGPTTNATTVSNNVVLAGEHSERETNSPSTMKWIPFR